MQLVEKRPGLLIRHVLEAALEDAATERMGREVVHTSAERSNEVESFGSHTLDELLDDMVAVGIEHTLERVALELLDKRRLLLGRDVLNRLLHNAAAVHLERQLENMAVHALGECVALDLGSVLEQLLYDLETGARSQTKRAMRRAWETHIVAEHILDKLQRAIWHDLVEHDLLLLRRCLLEPLLDEARAVLVTAELDNVTENFLCVHVSKLEKKNNFRDSAD